MNIYDWIEITQLQDEIVKYSDYEQNEHGEMVNTLVMLSSYPDYMSQELLDAVTLALKEELARYKKYFVFEEREETHTYKVKELVYKEGEDIDER